MQKIKFKRWPGSALWAIANIKDNILCTPAERRKIQWLRIGQAYFFQDWSRFWLISRFAYGDQIEEKHKLDRG